MWYSSFRERGLQFQKLLELDSFAYTLTPANWKFCTANIPRITVATNQKL